MLKIRLSRTGKRNQPHYRIIVTEEHSKRDGSYIANLGYYIPYKNPAILKLDTKAYDEWIGKGAQSTKVVTYLRGTAKNSEVTEIAKKPKTKSSKKSAAGEAAKN